MRRSAWMRRCTLCWTLVALLMAPGSVTAGEGSEAAARYYEEALVSFQGADYASAVIQLKNTLKLEPKDLPARILLGRAYLRQGHPRAAEKTLRFALDHGADPVLVEQPLLTAQLEQGEYQAVVDAVKLGAGPPERESRLLVLRGRAYLGLGRLDDAERSFAAAANLQPHEAGPQLGRARALLARGERRAAGQVVERVIAAAPEEVEGWYLKGEVLRLDGDLEGAVRAYERAIELDAHDLQARVSRAATLIDLGRDQQALGDIDFIREEVPSHPQATYLKALVLARQGDLEGARVVMTEAAAAVASLSPELMQRYPASELLAGVIGFNQGRPEEAKDHLQRFLAHNPAHAGARKLLGAIRLRQGDAAAAVEVLEPATRLAPRDAAIYALLGDAYQARRAYSQAVAMYERAVALAPGRALLRTQLGLSRMALGLGEAGQADLERASHMEGGARAGLLLGMLHLRRGETDEALAVARGLIERAPEDPTGLYLTGLAELRRGDPKAARRGLEEALRLDPELRAARLGLADVDLAEGRPEQARRRLEAMLAQRPRDAKVMLGLATLAQRQGRTDEAVDWLRKARDAAPEDVAPALRLIGVYLGQGATDPALEVARRLQDRAPEDPEVLEAVARVELARGNREHARITLRKMFSHAGNSAGRLYRTAMLQVAAEDPDSARFSLQQALSVDPSYLPAQLQMARLEARAGGLDEALARAAELQGRYPDSAVGLALRGELLLGAKRYAEAAQAYATAQKRAQSSALALGLYRARWGAGETEPALRGLQAWVDGHPKDLKARRELASGYLHAGRLRRARPLYAALIEAAPGDAALYNDLAWIADRLDDPQALGYARKALDLAPDQASALDTLGWVLVRRGQVEQGLAYLRKAHARASREPVVRYHLAVALTQLGREAEARDELEAALRQSDDFDGAREARALLQRLPAK